MPTNVGQEIAAPLTAEQGAAIRAMQASDRIYNWVLGAWESALKEVWDYWTDEDRTVRDQTKVAAVIEAMGDKCAATFSDSAIVTTMLVSVNSAPVVEIFQRYKLWDDDANDRVVPITINQDGTGSYDADSDLA